MTELHMDAKIICNDGECGKSTAVIVNPVRQEVTHLVVSFDYTEYMVPLSFVTDSDHDQVRLSCSTAELKQMPPFKNVQFVSDVDSSYMIYDEWAAPYVTAYPIEAEFMETELLPPGELAVHRGDPVVATDGHVGAVGEFVVDTDSGHISHLVLQKGHLWGKREVTLGIGLIDRVEDGVVYLTVDKAAINKLPAVKIRRHYPWQKDD